MQTRYETHALLRHTKENTKAVLTDVDTRVKSCIVTPIPRKTQKPS